MANAKIEHDGVTLATALAKFQAELPEVTLDGDNPHFKSKFTTLGELTRKVLPKLSEHGFAFSATPQVTESGFVLEAHLIHASGERLSASFPITETNPQKVGSAVTYFRRYALAALTGVVAETDDDGNAASIPPVVPRALQQAQAAKPQPTPVNKSEQNDLKKEIQKYIGGDEAKREAVNTVREKHVAAGLSGDDLFKAILAEVTA